MTFGHLDHRRHVAFLAFAIASSLISSHWRASLLPSASFALYGALHALTLVAALRGRQAVWRACAFVLAAAGTSALTAALGLRVMYLASALFGRTGSFGLLGVLAAFGALAYAVLIRVFGISAISARAAIAAAFACPLAVVVLLGTGVHASIGLSLTVSIAWWCAFSAVLCTFDRNSWTFSRRNAP